MAHLIIMDVVPPVLTFTDSGRNTSGSGGTFTGLNFGATASNRFMIASIGNNSSTATTAVSIGGVSASQRVAVNSPFGDARSSIWIAAVPTGTSGNVVISNGSGGFTTIALYSATGLLSSSAVDTATNSGGSPKNMSVSVPAFGVAVVCAYSSGASGTANWTNLTAVDTNAFFSSNFLTTAGHFIAPSSSTTLNTTVSYSATTNAMSCAAVSFR